MRPQSLNLHFQSLAKEPFLICSLKLPIDKSADSSGAMTSEMCSISISASCVMPDV